MAEQEQLEAKDGTTTSTRRTAKRTTTSARKKSTTSRSRKAKEEKSAQEEELDTKTSEIDVVAESVKELHHILVGMEKQLNRLSSPSDHQEDVEENDQVDPEVDEQEEMKQKIERLERQVASISRDKSSEDSTQDDHLFEVRSLLDSLNQKLNTYSRAKSRWDAQQPSRGRSSYLPIKSNGSKNQAQALYDVLQNRTKQLESILSELSNQVQGLPTDRRNKFPSRRLNPSKSSAGSKPRIKEKIKQKLRNMEKQLVSLYKDREKLAQETGSPSVEDAIERIKRLEKEIRSLRSKSRPASFSSPGQRIDLKGTEKSMEEQLNSLYKEREKLIREMGLNSNEEVIQRLRNWESQLNDLYRDRENLIKTTGLSSSNDIVSRLENWKAQLDDLYKEKEVLLKYTGTSSIDGVLEQLKNLEQQLNAHNSDIEYGRYSPDNRKNSLPSSPDIVHDQLQAMEKQLVSLYGEKEELIRTMGLNSHEEVVERLKNWQQQLDSLYAEREAMIKATGLSSFDDVLERLKNWEEML